MGLNKNDQIYGNPLYVKNILNTYIFIIQIKMVHGQCGALAVVWTVWCMDSVVHWLMYGQCGVWTDVWTVWCID